MVGGIQLFKKQGSIYLTPFNNKNSVSNIFIPFASKASNDKKHSNVFVRKHPNEMNVNRSVRERSNLTEAMVLAQKQYRKGF